MKTLVLILVFSAVLLIPLQGVLLISETFGDDPFSRGWTKSGVAQEAWSWSSTNLAGGAPGELKLDYSQVETGYHRAISNSFNTSKAHDMNLSFRHYLNDFVGNSEMYTLGVQISPDKINWTTVYSVTTTSHIPATLVNVTIPFINGMSSNTYIAFFMDGNNYDLNYWLIDDVTLSYENTLGTGTWPMANYYPAGNLIIPDGHTLSIEAGSVLRFEDDKTLNVMGRLLVNGTQNQRVCFEKADFYWGGIKLINIPATNDSTILNYATIQQSAHGGIAISGTNKVRISNCIVNGNYSETGGGGGISVVNSKAVIRNSSISYNNTYVPESRGGGILVDNSDCLISDCFFYWNYAYDSAGGGICIINSDSCQVINSTFRMNSSLGSGNAIAILSSGSVILSTNTIGNNNSSLPGSAISFSNSSGLIDHCLVANNNGDGVSLSTSDVDVTSCDIVNNEDFGLSNLGGSVDITNSIIWGNENSIFNNDEFQHASINYSCLGAGIVGGYNDYNNNIRSNPIFISPTPAADYLASTADWRLESNSPCINTADPALPLDADSSRADIGIYSRQLRPIIKSIADYYPDQGHQLDLIWQNSDIDTTFYANAFYSVWRQGTSRSDNDVFISDPSQITFGMQTGANNICWRDGTRIWYYIAQSPAVSDPEYGLIVPTLQDSSSTGTHAANYLVRYHNNNGIWASVTQSCYSVDNIPPYAAGQIEFQHTGTNQFNLSWQAVTEGGWEGNSYPETNLITYKIYAGDSPDFDISPTTYLLSTPNPSSVLNNQTAGKRFYKIVASDSE
jgi:hypothetical protein